MTETLGLPQPTERRLGTPFVGLVPYGEGDAAFFFGRDEEKEIVAGNLRAARLTILYGASGVGKSSLLHAGVVHDLHEQVHANAVGRTIRTPFAICAFSSWRDDPLPALAEAMRAACVEALGGEESPPWQPGEPLLDAVRAWTDPVRPLLVVLDQFEDYFLYHEGEDGEGTFAVEFPRLVNEPNLHVNFVLSLREDAWAKLDRFEGRIPALFANYVRVEHLDRDAARAAIEGPIEEWNRRLTPGDEHYVVEPALVDTVIEAAASGSLGLTESSDGAGPHAANADAVEAPFLQLVLERLWRATVENGAHTLDLARLEALGGAQQIVENHLLEALSKLTPTEQAVAADLFKYLVTHSKTKIAHPAADLAEWTGRPEPQITAVLEKLCRGESGRILRSVSPPTGETAVSYELFHDVLAEPILEWRRQFEQKRERDDEARRQRAVRKRLMSVAAVLLVLVIAFAGFALWALHERGVAARERRTAIDKAAIARSQALAANSLSQLEIDPQRSLLLALAAADARRTPQAEDALRQAVPDSRVRAILRGHVTSVWRGSTDSVSSAVFSPDGRLVVTAGSDGTARVWESTSGKKVAVLRGHTTPVSTASFSPNGRLVVTADRDGTARVWDATSGRKVAVHKQGTSGEYILDGTAVFSRDGRLVVTASGDSDAHVWEATSGRDVAVLHGHDAEVLSAAFDPDGRRVVTASADGTARVWGAVSGRQIAVLRVHADTLEAGLAGAAGWVADAVFSPDGSLIATVDGEAARVFVAASGRRVAVFRRHGGRVNSAAFSPDGSLVVTAGADGTAHIWEARSGAEVAVLHGHGDSVSSAAFSPDGRLIVTASDDKTARVWEAASGRELAVLRGHEKRISSAAFSADGRLVVTASDDNTARVWEATRGTDITLRGHVTGPGYGSGVSAVFSPDGRLVVTSGSDGTARVWKTASGKQVHALVGHSGYVTAAFSQDGRLIGTADDDTVRVWKAVSGAFVSAMALRSDAVNSVVFSPDVRLIVTVPYGDNTARVWSTTSGKQVTVVRGHGKEVTDADFSPDGRLVVTTEGKSARVWETASGREVAVLHGHEGRPFFSALFSPDGKLVVAASDNTVRVWNAASGAEVAVLRVPGHSISRTAFSPDSRLVVTTNERTTARVWKAASGRLVAALGEPGDVASSAAFSPDGRLVVTAEDKTARVWEAASGNEVVVFGGHDAAVGSVAFSPDGRLVITASEDNTVRIHTCEKCLPFDELLALARKRVIRSLTPDERREFLGES